MTLWTSEELERATGGKANGAFKVSGVTIDSRNVKPGELFVAIKGEQFDGHDFVVEALGKGAAAAIVSTLPANTPKDAKLLTVGDTLEALQGLGVAARARTNAKIVAITGSVGKTSTKEALACALSGCGTTYASVGNYNNRIGAPLCLANMPQDTQFGVFEVGMNHAGELSELTAWVRPDVAVVTAVEGVHLEFFKNEEGIADAKAEVFEGVREGGAAIINRDNRHFDRLSSAAKRCGIGRITGFGASEQAMARVIECAYADVGMEITASINGTPIKYRIGATGKHWGLVTVAALAAVDALGADLPKAAQALAKFTEPKGRGPLKLVVIDGKEVTLMDDSYNASPASMKSAFEKLGDLKKHNPKHLRTVAVLGDMLELGTDAQQMHIGLIPSLINNHIDIVFSSGQFMRGMYDALPEPMRGDYAPTAKALAPRVTGALKHRDLVLVKGSNGSRMSEIVRAIEAAGNPDKQPEKEDA